MEAKPKVQEDWVVLEELTRQGFKEFKGNSDFMIKYDTTGHAERMFQKAVRAPYHRNETWYYRPV